MKFSDPLVSRSIEGASTHVVCAVKTEEGVGGEHLRAGGECMADLEERRDGEALVQLGAQAREGLVGEENTALNLSGDVVDGAGVAQAERCSSVLEPSVCVQHGVNDAAGARRRL